MHVSATTPSPPASTIDRRVSQTHEVLASTRSLRSSLHSVLNFDRFRDRENMMVGTASSALRTLDALAAKLPSSHGAGARDAMRHLVGARAEMETVLQTGADPYRPTTEFRNADARISAVQSSTIMNFLASVDTLMSDGHDSVAASLLRQFVLPGPGPIGLEREAAQRILRAANLLDAGQTDSARRQLTRAYGVDALHRSPRVPSPF